MPHHRDTVDSVSLSHSCGCDYWVRMSATEYIGLCTIQYNKSNVIWKKNGIVPHLYSLGGRSILQYCIFSWRVGSIPKSPLPLGVRDHHLTQYDIFDHTRVAAKWYLNPSNGLTECTRVTDDRRQTTLRRNVYS